ncbi:hypothetical protein SERLADRAFT_400853 [Serpula lacrymans var. lacrymans S7.9]|nr:uncharacterized protein SERLADRAFT_400853 [Serpula lacrymans var. lacrymans S7.9]EGO19768.1 hypothetical protein SERLADRAFT_400853 [Serpula lacrymans var. lacrymans S7.9]
MAQQPPVHASPSKSSTTKRKKARIFAGEPQTWWGIKSYRDVEGGHDPASSSREGRIKGKGKEKAVEKPAVRMYVGDVSRLHAPYKRMSDDLICTPPPSSGFSGSVNSLTPLSALGVPGWPQPAVGECCSWPPPQGVCDDTGENRNAGLQLSTEDVAKAIQAALFAVA